ncbi:MAG: hypothetical protein M1833_006208 [Piccolia ochrophora]|nr:MAG: hypothetical protein M1833_006208 [Piccolia ochrophora]
MKLHIGRVYGTAMVVYLFAVNSLQHVLLNRVPVDDLPLQFLDTKSQIPINTIVPHTIPIGDDPYEPERIHEELQRGEVGLWRIKGLFAKIETVRTNEQFAPQSNTAVVDLHVVQQDSLPSRGGQDERNNQSPYEIRCRLRWSVESHDHTKDPNELQRQFDDATKGEPNHQSCKRLGAHPGLSVDLDADVSVAFHNFPNNFQLLFNVRTALHPSQQQETASRKMKTKSSVLTAGADLPHWQCYTETRPLRLRGAYIPEDSETVHGTVTKRECSLYGEDTDSIVHVAPSIERTPGLYWYWTSEVVG